MENINLLNNKGLKFIGNEQALRKHEKTLIVVGVARGGTSLISGSLDHLGVFTGEMSKKPVFEDVKLATAFEKSNIEEAKKIIKEYNNKNSIWAFKRPSAINYLHEINKLCRNPIYLFIFKDIFSIANRNNISMKLDIIDNLKKAHKEYGTIVDFISNTKINGFLFSYEKIMSNSKVFIDTLVDIIGKDLISNKAINNTLNFIEPNPKEYLDASRITKGIGQIGKIDKNYVIGWAKYQHSNKVAKVELYINDKYVDTVEAKDFRQFLLDNKTHPTGYCGYIFNLSRPLKIGDKVSVKISDDINFLKNSNQIFKG